jgi:poly(3-hydroxybutyrate) depolymerase
MSCKKAAAQHLKTLQPLDRKPPLINTPPPLLPLIKPNTKRFRADPRRVYLSGKSAGGVLVHAALCRSALIATKVRAAVDILGGLPEPMAAACRPAAQTNVLLVHGESDEHLPWARRVVLDYIPFMSKLQAAGFWRAKFGLFKQESRNLGPGGRYECQFYSKAGSVKQVAICGIKGAGHTTDLPYIGAPFGE